MDRSKLVLAALGFLLIGIPMVAGQQPTEENLAITLLDDSPRADLDRMTEINAKARYADRKVVQLETEGEGKRKLRLGDVIETPI